MGLFCKRFTPQCTNLIFQRKTITRILYLYSFRHWSTNINAHNLISFNTAYITKSSPDGGGGRWASRVRCVWSAPEPFQNEPPQKGTGARSWSNEYVGWGSAAGWPWHWGRSISPLDPACSLTAETSSVTKQHKYFKYYFYADSYTHHPLYLRFDNLTSICYHKKAYTEHSSRHILAIRTQLRNRHRIVQKQ